MMRLKMRLKKPVTLLSVVVVSMTMVWIAGVDAMENQMKTVREENLPEIGNSNGPQISHDRIKRASAAADSDVCTLKDLREFTKSNDFSAAVDYWVKNEGDKKYQCIKRHGTNAYYDPDLHACGDCLDEDCPSNDVCMQECAQFLENKNLRENLNDTSKALEMLKKERDNDHKLLEDLALQQKTTESELSHLKKTVESLQTTMLSQFQNMSDEMKSSKAEVTGLKQQNAWLWPVAVLSLLIATAAITLLFVTRNSNPKTQNQLVQPSGDVEAEQMMLMGSSSTASTPSVPSLNTATAAATQGATAPLPPPTTPPRDNREERVDIEIMADRRGTAGPP